MKLKTYETPEAELLRISVDRNFCESGGLSDYETITPGGDFFDVPGFDDIPGIF